MWKLAPNACVSRCSCAASRRAARSKRCAPANAIIASASYTAGDVPPSSDERVRLNLWLFEGRAPTDGQPVEIVVDAFTFTPLTP